DGRRIIFGLYRPPDFSLYWKDASGAGNEQLLLQTSHWVFPTDWSRDGRFILYAQLGSKTKWDIWVLPLFGDRKPIPLAQTAFYEFYASFSPDGRWIAYCSDESGRFEIYVCAFTEGGEPVKAG